MLDSPLHENYLLRYKVSILDKPIRNSSKTAEISFFDENDKRVTVFKLGLITPEEVFELIDKGESINLNNLYVKDFSLTDYRVNKGFDDHKYIVLKNFSAKKAFFDCDISTDFSYAEFEGDKTVFEAAIFGNGSTSFFNCNFGNGDVSFKKAKFGSGSVNFKSAIFGEGAISFANTNFGNGNLSFVDTNFGNGNVDFKSTYYGDGSVDFKFAKFAAGDVTFERAIFGKGKKDFKNVEFGGGKIDFRRIEFNDGDVSFEGVEFGDGKVSFRSSEFGYGHKNFELSDFAKGEAQFDLVDFGTGTISFNKAKVADISFKGCPLNCFMDLRFEQCDLLDLSNTIVRDILQLKPEDETVVIKNMLLVDMRILGRIFIDWHANNVFDCIYTQKLTSNFQKAEQFRILKENFRNNGQYDDEDSAYLEFKRCESKAHLQDAITKNKRNAFWAYPLYYFQTYVFDFVGRYATDPIRVLFNMMLAYSGFSLIYWIFSISPQLEKIGHVVAGGAECVKFTELSAIEALGNSLYFSGITFMTVGYGDYFVNGCLKPVAVFEGFTGVFLMSYFTVAFVRKILR